MFDFVALFSLISISAQNTMFLVKYQIVKSATYHMDSEK